MTFSTSQRVAQELLSDRMSSLRGLAQGSLGKERQAAGPSWGREPLHPEGWNSGSSSLIRL